jgi:hypothetical protein
MHRIKRHSPEWGISIQTSLVFALLTRSTPPRSEATRQVGLRLTDRLKGLCFSSSGRTSQMVRLLKTHHLIASRDYIVMKDAGAFNDTALNQRWQTDFTFLKVIGWGWYHSI